LGGYTSCAGFVSTRGPVARKKKEKKSICLCRFSCRFVSHAKKNVINNDGKNVTEKFNAHGARALKLHRSCEKYAGFFLDFSHFALTAATGRTSFTTGLFLTHFIHKESLRIHQHPTSDEQRKVREIRSSD
jgi:hypothetical protein